MAEAVNGTLDKKRSGRKSLQTHEDAVLLQQVLPTLSEALVLKHVPEMQIARYAESNLHARCITSHLKQELLT